MTQLFKSTGKSPMKEWKDPGIATGHLTITFTGGRVEWTGRAYFLEEEPKDWISGWDEVLLKDELGNEYYEACYEHELWGIIDELLDEYDHGTYRLRGTLDIDFYGVPVYELDGDYWHTDDVDWYVAKHVEVEPDER